MRGSVVTYDFLENEAAFADFIAQFETGTLPRPTWTHGAHLAVATWYLLTLPERNAIASVRTGIRHYNECAGIRNTPNSGYHETLTMFWLRKIMVFLAEPYENASHLETIRRVVARFGPERDLYRQHYNFDIVRSEEARARWIPPDKMLLC
jgi:hypothetical protein